MPFRVQSDLLLSPGVVAAALSLAAWPALGQEAPPEGSVEGPFLLHNEWAVEVGVRFDEAAVRAALPEGLEPVEGLTGGIAVYATDTGYALAPYTAGYLWIDVAGHDTPSGEPGRYMVRGYYSENMHRMSDLATQIVLGSGTMSEEADGTFHYAAGPEGQTAIDIVVRPGEEACQTGIATVSNYVLNSATSGLGVMHIPIMLDFCPVEPVSATITPIEGDDSLAGLQPQELLWAGWDENTYFAFVPLVSIN